MDEARMLLVVGMNPPLTSGERTHARCALAARTLGFDDYRLGNLTMVPTLNVLDLNIAATHADPWLEARTALAIHIVEAQGALLAYGVSSPTGQARLHFQTQVAWLESMLRASQISVWQVGNRPHHPSRWQRYTSRAHAEIPFSDALRMAIVRCYGDTDELRPK